MLRPSDETLVAFADGCLAREDAAAVERWLDADADLRRLVEALRRSGALIGAAFERPMREPAPAALVDALMRPPAVGQPAMRQPAMPPPAMLPQSATGAVVVPLAARASHARVWPGGTVGRAMGIAASVALLIGASGGFVVGTRVLSNWQNEIALGPVAAGTPMHELLESKPSGIVLPSSRGIAAPRQLTVIATFLDRQARPCREVELHMVGKQQALQAIAAAVACRSSKGVWGVEGAARLATAGGATTDPTYAPSGVRHEDALEGLLSLLGADRAMSPGDERALIDRSWR